MSDIDYTKCIKNGSLLRWKNGTIEMMIWSSGNELEITFENCSHYDDDEERNIPIEKLPELIKFLQSVVDKHKSESVDG